MVVVAALLAVFLVLPRPAAASGAGLVAIGIQGLSSGQVILATGNTGQRSLTCQGINFNHERNSVAIGLGKKSRQVVYWDSDPGPGDKYTISQATGDTCNSGGINYFVYVVTSN